MRVRAWCLTPRAGSTSQQIMTTAAMMMIPLSKRVDQVHRRPPLTSLATTGHVSQLFWLPTSAGELSPAVGGLVIWVSPIVSLVRMDQETRWAIGRMGDMPDSGLRVPKTCRARLCAPGSIADSKLWWCLLSCNLC